MPEASIFHYIGIAICILFSAFFSASEIAFSSVNLMRLKSKAEKGNVPARLAVYIVENFDNTLSTILIGNNLVNIAATSISTVLVIALVGEKGTFLATLVITVIILIFGEITPKIIAKKIPFQFALFASLPVRVLMLILSPVIKVVVAIVGLFSKRWKNDDDEKMTVEELTTIIEHIEDDGIIDKEKSDLLQLTLEFSDISASEIITPRRDLVAIDIDDDKDEIMDLLLDTPFTRIPVYKDNIDNIIGIIHVGRILEKLIDKDDDYSEIDKLIMELMRKPVFIFESKKLPETFNMLNTKKTPLAIIVDEYGGTTGCLTVEDIVEELVGDIWDEYDTVRNYIREIGDGTYEVSGDLGLREFALELDIDRKLVDSEFNTVSGWLIDRFNGIPEVGEAFKIENIYIEVLAIDEYRVDKVLVCLSDFDEMMDERMNDL
ncbi:MAG TPA: HlyC/CorC family transporter [Clostridiaceae bacterium]|nr:HlyC/CorC family transporter [Clostridiaceae bacterium]